MRLPRLRPTSLRAALIFDLAVIGVSAAALIFAVVSLMIRHSFGDLEAADVARNVDRTRAALAADLAATEAHVLDWGIWDETYDYLKDFNAGYEARNFNAGSFVNAEISCAAYMRFDGGGQRSFCFDADSDEPDPELAAAFARSFRAIPLQASRNRKGSRVGYWSHDGQLFAVASTPVLRSDGSGSPEGKLAFLHRIDALPLAEALQVPVRLDFAELSATPQLVEAGKVLHVSVPVATTTGPPVAMLRFDLPRQMLVAGERLRDLTVLAMLALLAALLALLGRRLSTQVMVPLLAFREHVGRIRHEGELVPLSGPPREDEIGALQWEFNAMAAELEALRLSHAAQSFALGREQNAIGLLHNLRNSLSPVRVILSDLERHLGAILPAEAERARAELADPQTAAERRRRLVAYLDALEADRADRSGQARALLQEAGRCLSEALEAMRAPRDPEKVNRNEECDLSRALAHAATAARFADGPKIDLTIECPPDLQVCGNRVLLAQVLENLVVNATEAIRATGRTAGRIDITASPTEGTGRCVVLVRDDGDGFDEPTGARLFERGFSTRTDKRGGLGLHWCANTLAALGGSLSLTSPGPGQGALARLDLPLMAAAARALRRAG
ncbi:signal transduction histidine kinase [Rhodobacter viridis]|uniref:Signal transduction histidine-protein kinase/phosphatase MprB n=1 Tax=Rhodobacter viridis TaxID=1054202 RepID=A0A318TS84_9RHOB|nr:CHASE4 domain-containing protein [Rhodobacter viridis]PYF07484.1 signal transduction histidine kinase [Rhodobacter viridis]